MKQLENHLGVPVKINNENYILRATLLTVCADTLAAHDILGFIGPSANLFRRLCTLPSNEKKFCPYSSAPLRNKELREQNVKDVKEDKAMSTVTGVKNNSLLNELEYYHCTQNYVFDIMHDILECQAHYDLKLVIAHMTMSKEYDVDVNNFQ